MNRKKQLPKAITWTADAMREAAADVEQMLETQHPLGLHVPSAKNVAGSPDNIIAITARSDGTSTIIPNAVPLTVAPTQKKMTIQRLRALAIVERHANYSAIGGIIPVPVANVASITAAIVRMVKSLSDLYGVPFERNRARAIVIGLMGGVMPTGLATIATSALIYFVPGYNLVGLAISSVTASAYARSIGQMFIDHFENGSTLVDFPSAVLR